MSINLNLLPSQAKFQAAKIKLKRRILIFSGVFVSIWLLIVVVVFVVFFVNQGRLSSANKALVREQNLYKNMSGDAVLSYQIKYMAKLVGKVLNERFEYGSSIEKIGSLFSSNVELLDYQIDKTKQFVLSGRVANGANMDEVEKVVQDINNGKVEDFKAAKLDNIAINLDGLSWKFTMEVTLK